MATFLFWNVNGKPLEGIVRNLTRRHDVDVLVLVESKIPPGRMLETLNRGGRRIYHFAFPALEGIAIYMRYSLARHHVIDDQHPGTRVTIREITIPLGMPILLVAVHLPDKLRWSHQSQTLWCPRIADRIRRAEEAVGHSNTVLVGDLNMNPFDDGLIGANGLHATMARDVARKGSRRVLRERFPYFYNPMWPLLGDAGIGRPSGTYYHRRGEPVEFFWNMFDQVLIRPALLDLFRDERLTIVTDDGSTPLLSGAGRPRKRAVSDHLPVAFTIDL